MNEELRILLDNARASGANASQLQGIVDAYNLKKKDKPNGTGSAINGGEIGGIAGASKAQSVGLKVNPTVDYLSDRIFNKEAEVAEPIVTFKSGAKAKVIAPIPQANEGNNNIKYANQLQAKIDNGLLDDDDENNIASANGVSKDLVKAQVKNNKAQIDYFSLQEEKKAAKEKSQKLLGKYNFLHNTQYSIEDIENDFELGKAIVADLKAKDNQSFSNDEQQQNKIFASNPTELNNVARDNNARKIKYENSLDFEAINNLVYIKEKERKILNGATAKEVADFDYEEKYRKKSNKIDKAIASTNIGTASMSASNIPTANAIGLLRNLTTSDETEQLEEKRNAYYGYSELSANNAFNKIAVEKQVEYNYNLDRLNEKVASGEKPTDDEILNLKSQEENLNRLKSSIKQDSEILVKYPSIRSQKVTSLINDYKALKSNNTEDADLNDEEIKLQKSGGLTDKILGGDVGVMPIEKAKIVAYLKSKGVNMQDQATIDAINSYDDNTKEYSYFGGVGKNFLQPFEGAIKSLGDITGLRTEIDRRLEVTNEEFNPTQIGKDDRLKLTKTASTIQNVSNTTSNVLGQLALSTAIGGVGRIATLGNVAKNVNAVANTLESVDAASKTSRALKGFKDLVGINDAQQAGAFLSSYDDAMKDADEFLDNPIAKGLYSYLVGQFNAKTSKIFDETKLPQLLQNVKPQFAAIAKKLSSGDFDAELLKNTLKSATQKTLEYGKAVGANVLQEVSEETLTSGLTDATKILFGDSETNINKLIENAKETAIQTAIGTSLLGLGGGVVDVKRRNSGNAMNTLYNAAIYHDEATDAINKGFEQGIYNEQEKNTKISILETAKSKLPQISIAEELMGKDFSRGQRAAFVGNLTSQSIINEKIKNTESEAIKEELTTKLTELKQQEKDILGNKITLNEDGTYSKVSLYKIDGIEVSREQMVDAMRNENKDNFELFIEGDKQLETELGKIGGKDVASELPKTATLETNNDKIERLNKELASITDDNNPRITEIDAELTALEQQPKTIDIIPALKEKLSNVTVDNDAELLSYAIDKVAEAPIKLKTDLGDELFSQVLAQTPTEKLQEGLDFLINNNPDSKDVDVLYKIISEREAAATKIAQPKISQSAEVKQPTNKAERLAAFKNKYVEPVQTDVEVKKQWNELPLAEKLALAKENLPQVDNLSNVDAIKVADANAKMLLSKLNKTKSKANENIQESIQQTNEGITSGNESIPSKEGSLAKEGNGENIQSQSSERAIEQSSNTSNVENNSALKDVESTAKALEDIAKSSKNIKIPYIGKFADGEEFTVDLSKTQEYTDFSGTKRSGFKGLANSTVPYEVVAESYHKAKVDGSNPKLVKAVEDLLRKESNTSNVESFETAKGSKYVVGADGKTTRFKTATNEQKEPQDLTLFTKFEGQQADDYLQALHGYNGETVHAMGIIDGKVQEIKTNEDAAKATHIKLTIVDKDGKITAKIEALTEPTKGYNVFDQRQVGENKYEKHIGNEVSKINHKHKGNTSNAGVEEGSGVGGDVKAKNKAFEELVNLIPTTDLRRPNGSIGTQGFSPENLVEVARHIAKEMGFDIPAYDKNKGTSEIKQVIDYLKNNKEAQQKIRDYVVKDPVVVSLLPDNTYEIEDGNHRANLLNLIGVDVIPTIELNGRDKQTAINEHNSKVEAVEQSIKETTKAGSVVGGEVEIKNEGKADAPTKESVTERLSINNPFYKKVEDALVKLGLIEKYNAETGTGDVVGGYAQQTSDGGFSVGKMLFSQDGSISYFDGDVKVSFDKNGNVISENTKEAKQKANVLAIESKKESIDNLEKTRDSEAFKYKEVTETDTLGNKKKVKRLKTEQELKDSTDKINAAIDKAKAELSNLEQSLKETTKSETPTTNTGVEEGSGGIGGDEKTNTVNGYEFTKTPTLTEKYGLKVTKLSNSDADLISKQIFISDKKQTVKDGITNEGGGWYSFDTDSFGGKTLYNKETGEAVELDHSKGGRMGVIINDFVKNNDRTKKTFKETQKIIDNASYTPRSKNGVLVRLPIDFVLDNQEKDFKVERGKNEIGNRIDKAKKFLETNPKELEASDIYIKDSGKEKGKIGFGDGRHRLVAAKELGATHAYFELPATKEQFDALNYLLSEFGNEKGIDNTELYSTQGDYTIIQTSDNSFLLNKGNDIYTIKLNESGGFDNANITKNGKNIKSEQNLELAVQSHLQEVNPESNARNINKFIGRDINKPIPTLDKISKKEQKKIDDELEQLKETTKAETTKEETTQVDNNLNNNTDANEQQLTDSKLTEQDNLIQEPILATIESEAANVGSNKQAAEEVVKKVDKLINNATDVVNVPIAEIKQNEKEYQGRKNAFSERSANNVANNFDKNKFDPIVVYKHSDGNTYVLSGHSRLEGMKRRGEQTIPARYFVGTDAQAKEFALNSNKLGTLQTDLENADYYRKKLQEGASYNAIITEAKANEQDGTATRIVDYAHLDPKGKAYQALESLQKGEGDSANNIKSIAQKIGRIKSQNEHLTTAHENELFDYFLENGVPSDKELNDPNTQLSKSINATKFDNKEPLNLQKLVVKSDARVEWEKEKANLEKQRDELKKEVNPSKQTGWTGLKEKAIALLSNGNNSKASIDKAEQDFNNNKDGIKDAYNKKLADGKLKLQAVNDKLAKHLLQEKNLIQGDKAQQSLFSIQSPTTDEISDMKDIVKDYVDEGTASLQDIQDDVAKELGDNSQEMKDLVEKAYNEFYKTKESTPIEVTSGVIGKVGKFLSRLFGGTAASKVFVAKDEKSLMDKANSLANVSFMNSPDGKVLGFAHDGKIYLNGEQLNTNTPIHEAGGHIWTEWAKTNNTKVYNRGMQLTENSKYLKEVKANEFYKAEASKLGSETSKEYNDYMKHEALAMAIGDKGAQFVGETRKKDFKEWLNNLWNKIKEVAGFKDITASELQNLTFDEFTKRAAADILRDEEIAQPQGQQQQQQTETSTSPIETPQPKIKSKLTDVELGVIRNVLESTIDAKQYPTFFDMNQPLVQQTAKTQGEGQERTPLDGTYIQAHLADLRSISLNNARVLQDALGNDWKEKMINFFEENPKAGDIAVVSGILNVMNTDINNEITASKNGTEISKLKDLQARADRITYDTSRSASLALNQRRLYQDFGQGKTVADIISSIILTPEQQDIKRKVEEALKQKFTDEELNKQKKSKPKNNAQAKTPKQKTTKNEDSIKKDLISKGQKAAQQIDVDGNVTIVSLKDKIQQANDALNGFKC